MQFFRVAFTRQLPGGLSLLILYAALYTVQFYRLSLAGETPRLVFGVFDQKTGTIGAVFFTWLYLIGQVFNALLEESIFRGLILPHVMLKSSFWKANVIQAFLFGLAHLVFPLSSWLWGQATAGAAVSKAAFLYYHGRTSLWLPILPHGKPLDSSLRPSDR